MLQRARAKPAAEGIDFVCHDLSQPLPLADAAFDRVLCCLVLDHIENLEGFFRELHRLCRPDGSVLVSTMHPAMLLRGVQARFIDPATGSRVYPQSHPHQIADYLMAAVRAGLILENFSEHAVDSALAARSPRGTKYLGWPLLLLMRLLPSARGLASSTAQRQTQSIPSPLVGAAVSIRRAEPADLPAVTQIYNEAILTTTASFDTQPKTLAERTQWLASHDERHPVLVAICNANVVGWASLTKWSDRCAYDDTAETSFYVISEYRGQGIGRALKQAIIEEARRLKFHTLIARVAQESHESLHLNESLGFVHVGTLRQVGRKFGRLLDVHILQKML
jgi:phosphinothricin acetyltransferase